MNTNSAAEFGNKVQSCGTEYYYYYFISRISYSLFSVLFRYYSSSAFSTFWIRLFEFRFLRRFFLNEFYKHKVTCTSTVKKGKGSPYSISERRVPELILVLCSQPAGDGGRLPLLSARPAVTPATLKRAKY